MPTPARAELVIDVRRGNVPADADRHRGFRRARATSGSRSPAIITNNLQRSGYFVPIDKARFPEQQPSFDAAPRFEAWKAAGAQGARDRPRHPRPVGAAQDRVPPVGRRCRPADHRASNTSPIRTTGAASAHIISDAVYTKITGVGGFFDTRVVFVDESGPKENRRKRLAIMDQDGANVRYLTQGDNLVVTPRYSPATQDIAYMSQASGQQPRVQVINLETGSRQVVGNFPDMTSSPALLAGRAAHRHEPAAGRQRQHLHDGPRARARPRASPTTSAIDTSPSFSPDGREIVFESDRGGQQQIYVMARRRLQPAPHLVRRRLLFAAGLVAARRLHRLHQAHGRAASRSAS